MCDLVTLFLVVVTKTFESPPQLYEVAPGQYKSMMMVP
jgi:hypothetical protein